MTRNNNTDYSFALPAYNDESVLEALNGCDQEDRLNYNSWLEIPKVIPGYGTLPVYRHLEAV
jgi:hypothetical protein